jgi:hypothetical protein
MIVKAFALAGVAASVFTLPAAAHHSFAMFDADKMVSLQGTVKEFEWVNPHSWLHVVVTDKAGAAKEWSVEMASVGALSNVGWTQDTVKAGDKVTIEMHPLKDGTRGGTVVSVTLPNGKKLGSAGQRNDPLKAGAD